MLKQIHNRLGITALVTAIGLTLPLQGQAQINEQEFQMGRARETCSNQAKQQLLNVRRIVSTTPVSSGSGQMIGSEVILTVSRQGATYNVRCLYDNISRAAIISNVPDSNGTPPGNSGFPPTEGTFAGRGTASGSVFTAGRQAEATLNFNQTRFSLFLAVPPGTGTQVNYNGTITRLRGTSPTNPNTFVIDARVQTFASSATNLRVINTSGICRIEVFDARVTSTSCNTSVRNSSSRFQGMQQF